MGNQTIYTMESVNLLVGTILGGTVAPGYSTHLTIQELKLPAMEEAYVDHMPGGAPVSIEIMMHVNKLESTFNLAGFNPDIMRVLGTANMAMQVFTANGLIRDRRSGQALAAQAIMVGRLGRVNPTAFRKGDLMSHEYSIRSIIKYSLHMQEIAGEGGSGDLKQIYNWDFFTSDFYVGDINLNTEMINTLGIPTVASPPGNA